MTISTHHKSILIIEDDPSTNRLWVKSLRDDMTNVTGVTSLYEAYRYMDVYGLPDLILLDLELPDGLGTDLLRTLRKADIIHETQIIVISSNIYASHIPLGDFKRHIRDALLKPISPRDLGTLVSGVLTSRIAM